MMTSTHTIHNLGKCLRTHTTGIVSIKQIFENMACIGLYMGNMAEASEVGRQRVKAPLLSKKSIVAPYFAYLLTM